MSTRNLLILLIFAVALTVMFWAPLWQGGGLIGGDLYPYFFPQKTVYADLLAENELPLWNRLVGFGYPLLAESQTGVFYPPNPLLYRLLSVNAAYNASQILHYVLAFVFTWMLMRRLDLSAWGATLAAVVFVYGWFPPRICLEWAIIGGVYLPLCLWCTESFLQTARRSWLIGLAAAMGVHMLAGHFNLAFITLLTVVGYAILRLMMSRRILDSSLRSGRVLKGVVPPLMVAVACGFALSAVQLLPTWQLKKLSQREEVGAHHNPGYGHIPPWYLSQIAAPWLWYTSDTDPDQALNSIKLLSIPSATNKVEAHLYFGLLPLLLIGYRLLLWLRGEPLDRRHFIWLLIGLAAMIYTTGWLLPVTRHLPGFSFFMGPGRYGIVTTLAAGLLAGAGLDRLLGYERSTPPRNRDQRTVSQHPRLGERVPLSWWKTLLAIIVISATLSDLFWVSRRVTYAVMVPDPPVDHRQESEVRRVLIEYERGGPDVRPVRVWSPGANVFTLTGFTATPVYLGLGPVEYFDPEFTMPEPPPDASPVERADALTRQKEWLREAAVTHILRMEPLNTAEWPEAKLVWQGFDRLLNPAWGRFQQPLYLYEFIDSKPYARLESSDPSDRVRITDVGDGFVAVDVQVAAEGAVLTVAQLNYPGWSVAIDGVEQQPTSSGPFLAVELPAGQHHVEWRFAPPIVWWGAAISLVALCGLVAAGFGLSWRMRGRINASAAAPPAG